jgi:hypothetical protein
MKSLLLWLLICCLPFPVLAQIDTLWTHSYSTRTGNMACYSMDSAWGGGYVLAGRIYTYGWRGKYFILKVDEHGDSLWCRTDASLSSTVPYTVHRTFDGGYFLAGKCDTTGSDNGGYWLMKTDSIGVPLWNRIYRKPDQTQQWAHCFAAIQTADSGFLLTGILGTGYYDTANEVWILKTNSVGDTVWSRGFRSISNYSESRALCELADGSFVVECKFMGQGFGILHLSASGDSLSYHSYFSDYSMFYALVPTRDGGFFLAGRNDYWNGPGWRWLRLNDQFEPLWSGAYGTAPQYYCEAHMAMELPDSGFIVAGTALENAGCTFIRLNSSGQILSAQTVAGSADEFWSILPYQTNSWLAAGFSDSGPVRLWAIATDSTYYVFSNPARIDFGTVMVGDSVSRQGYIINRSRAPVTIMGGANAHPDQFRIDPIGQTQINAGDSVMYRVVCANQALNHQRDTITFSFDPPAVSIQVSLHVFGEHRPVYSEPASIDFGTVVIGDTVSRHAYLVNSTLLPVTISGIDTPHPDQFAVDQIGQTHINAGDSMGYRVVCSNHTLLLQQDTVTFSFANYPEQVKIPLRVFGEQRADAQDEMNSATQFKLSPNYPNPFNPETRISFDLPQSGQTQLQIFDINGRTVATLLSGIIESGHHELAFNGTTLPSGVYFYHLQSGDYSTTRKMLLLK